MFVGDVDDAGNLWQHVKIYELHFGFYWWVQSIIQHAGLVLVIIVRVSLMNAEHKVVNAPLSTDYFQIHVEMSINTTRSDGVWISPCSCCRVLRLMSFVMPVSQFRVNQQTQRVGH